MLYGNHATTVSISRSPEIPDQPNCTLVNDNNSDLFSLQEIFFVGAEYLLRERFFLLKGSITETACSLF